MPAFLIVHSKLTDADAFEHYVKAAGPSLERYQGTYLLGGSLSEVLEGSHDKDRTIIFQFPSIEDAKSWYQSKEYQSVKPLREHTGAFDFVLVNSF
ncbi:DUF1330 domain-containing protein [Candidatus Njordibacter sp. Uisw_058]|uniref:DUF1330 domain-containing protein n=1 Tax=Candidatus Njordibacter sp. Uisw_058 TaxID=3230974 RepID=UPI003D43D82B